VLGELAVDVGLDEVEHALGEEPAAELDLGSVALSIRKQRHRICS
jgi:hypothetical protein